MNVCFCSTVWWFTYQHIWSFVSFSIRYFFSVSAIRTLTFEKGALCVQKTPNFPLSACDPLFFFYAPLLVLPLFNTCFYVSRRKKRKREVPQRCSFNRSRCVAEGDPEMAAEKSNMAMDNDERKEAVPSHLFVELTSLAELSFPTTASSRIKVSGFPEFHYSPILRTPFQYTCVCASPHILAVGSSSGTVYLFSRYAAKNRKSLCNVPVQVIPCQVSALDFFQIIS